MAIELAGVIGRGGFRIPMELHVDSGATVIVRGPNGAGKTTLLRTLAGLDALVDGTLRLEDQVVDDRGADTFVAAHSRPVAMAFQEPRLFTHLDVVANVAFGLRWAGLDKPTARARALAALESTGALDLAHRRPAELSGGQAQRVGLARALAPQRPILLVDEPLSAVDSEVRSELRHLIATQTATTVWVSHADHDAVPSVERVVTLD
jgi:molybdate transport system ATP-binding protein